MLIALTPFTARMINDHLGKWSHRRLVHQNKEQLQLSKTTGPMVTAIIAITLIISASINPHALAFLTPKKIFNVEAKNLNQLVNYLDENLPTGNMFNEYSLGGYLLYALTPPPKVFIDGRADMYGEQILSDYIKIESSSSEREELLEKYEIDWVVFQKDSNLISDLKKSGNWQTAYTNEHDTILTRLSSHRPTGSGNNVN